MIELELLGLGADGESLVFTDPDGERYATPITDELRGALRRERPQLDVAPEPSTSLKPSQIQTLLRAGLSAEEIAMQHHVDLDLVERFEPPVQAEKEYTLSRVHDVRIGGEPDGPRMGELVVDRLATRGVQPSSILWSARRDVDSPWEVCVTFVQGAAEHAAHWRYDTSSSTVEAIDQEARWLTETTAPATNQVIFAPVSPAVRDDVDPQAAAADVAQREALLDQLNAARGKRVEIDFEADEDDDLAAMAALTDEEPSATPSSPSISARIYSLAHAKTKREHTSGEAPVAQDATESEGTTDSSQASTDAEATTGEPSLDTLPGLDVIPSEPAPKEKKKTKRRSVPSWDEIVFGSKP